MVAEDGGVSYLPKGTRVLLHAVIDAPDYGHKAKNFAEDDFLLCGRTADGYLRDLVNLPPENVTALPDSVSDEKALLLHHVALAKAAADKLGVKKGQHVAVVGANLLGILLCQLLIYQQAAPILIDAEPERLEFAKSCGIYYTMAADENLLNNVANVTGGQAGERRGLPCVLPPQRPLHPLLRLRAARERRAVRIRGKTLHRLRPPLPQTALRLLRHPPLGQSGGGDQPGRERRGGRLRL